MGVLRTLSLVVLATAIVLGFRLFLDPETPLSAPYTVPSATESAKSLQSSGAWKPATASRRLVAVVTGSSTGIGRHAAEAFGAIGYEVIIAARNAEQGEKVAKSIPGARFVALELSSLASVRSFAARARLEALDLLVLNAGHLNVDFETTEQGFESTYGVNAIGHHALFRALEPHLLRGAAPVRVVAVSSSGHRNFMLGKEFKVEDYPMDPNTFQFLQAYGASKVANVMLARQIAKRYDSSKILAASVHPGSVRTAFSVPRPITDPNTSFGTAVARSLRVASTLAFWTFLPLALTAEQGAQSVVYASLSPLLNASTNGAYFSVGDRILDSSDDSMNESKQDALWKRMEELTRV